MRISLAFAALCLTAGCLPGCTPAQIQQACAYDALGQPLAVAAIGVLAPVTGPASPAVAAGIAVDTTVVHPSVQAACPALIAAAGSGAVAAPGTPGAPAAPAPH